VPGAGLALERDVGHAEGVAVVINVVIGLITSVISGGAVWLWGRITVSRRQRRLSRWYGVRPGGRCLIIMPRNWRSERTVARNDAFSVFELAGLMRDLRAEVTIVASDERTLGVDEATEFCVGGPSANERTGAHLERFLPGVSATSYADADPAATGEIAVGGHRFGYQPDAAEYAILARISVGERRLFLVSGQTSRANRAAVRYLADPDRTSGDRDFCLILRVVNPRVYGHMVAEVVLDASEAAFTHLRPQAGTGVAGQDQSATHQREQRTECPDRRGTSDHTRDAKGHA
jgi:hypothetical protein